MDIDTEDMRSALVGLCVASVKWRNEKKNYRPGATTDFLDRLEAELFNAVETVEKAQEDLITRTYKAEAEVDMELQ